MVAMFCGYKGRLVTFWVKDMTPIAYFIAGWVNAWNNLVAQFASMSLLTVLFVEYLPQDNLPSKRVHMSTNAK